MGYIKQSELAEWRESNKPRTCPILGHPGYAPVVDHDHFTGRIRGVLSREGNILLGKAENFFLRQCKGASCDLPDALRNMADYLEREQGPMHPFGLTQLVRRFSAKNKDVQEECLFTLGVPSEQIKASKNNKHRAKLYREAIKSAHSK